MLLLELNSSSYGYKIRTDWITNLFYMDNLKIYAKDDSKVEGLLKIVKEFSDNIGMESALSKYAQATFKRGKSEKSDHVQLEDEAIIKDLEQEKFNKYLGFDESIGIQYATIKQKLKMELARRTRLILKSQLRIRQLKSTC